MEYLVLVPVAYLLGSIPTGLLLVRYFKGVDVREVGSRKIGSTNVLRTAGPSAAAIVLLVDMGKGVAAVGIAHLLSDSALAQAIAGIVAVVGHSWSPFIGFRGGRGAAPGLGALLLMLPWAGLAGAIVFILVALLSRYVSLATLTGVTTAMAFSLTTIALEMYPSHYAIYAGVVGSLLVVRHWDNIQRLLSGKERRIGERVELRQSAGAKGEEA